MTCVLGLKNSSFHLNYTEFCEENIPDGIVIPQVSSFDDVILFNTTVEDLAEQIEIDEEIEESPSSQSKKLVTNDV